MNRTLLLTTLALALGSPVTQGKSELEVLRALCAEQERQIRQLETENSRLRDATHKPRPLTSATQSISTRPAAVSPSSQSNSDVATTYTIKPGDSLEKIARKTGVSVATLAQTNGLNTRSILHLDQKLKLPAAATITAATNAAPTGSTGATYKVQPGDTYYSISKKHGVSTERLIAANPNTKPSALRPGQLVNLAASEAPVATGSAPAPAASPQNPTTPNTQVVEEVTSTPASDKRIRPIMIEGEITYGDFAAKYGTDAERLNSLNGLDLTTATVLAKGSELYVPAQP